MREASFRQGQFGWFTRVPTGGVGRWRGGFTLPWVPMMKQGKSLGSDDKTGYKQGQALAVFAFLKMVFVSYNDFLKKRKTPKAGPCLHPV